jgi:hypothetical protein
MGADAMYADIAPRFRQFINSRAFSVLALPPLDRLHPSSGVFLALQPPPNLHSVVYVRFWVDDRLSQAREHMFSVPWGANPVFSACTDPLGTVSDRTCSSPCGRF